MTTFTVEHVDYILDSSFEEATARLLREVPLADPAELKALKNRAGVEAMMHARATDLGILVMTKLEQGPVVSLFGPPLKVSIYLIGSPLLGARLFVKHRAAGLYAPAHVTLYEDTAGKAHFAYDTPSSLLARFDDADATLIGRAFDQKLALLGRRLAGR